MNEPEELRVYVVASEDVNAWAEVYGAFFKKLEEEKAYPAADPAFPNRSPRVKQIKDPDIPQELLDQCPGPYQAFQMWAVRTTQEVTV